MIPRLRSIVRAEGGDPIASPHPGEAFGGWMLGTLAALACLWLGEIGTRSLVPGVLVAALLALVGWRHLEWLFWLPPVLVVAVLLQPFAPMPGHGRLGAMAYVDMLMVAVAVIALVRAVALKRRPMPRTPLDQLMVALLVLSALVAIPAQSQRDSLVSLKVCAVGIGVFYATATIASRPGGSRWVWPAYPLAAGLVGAHAIVAALSGPGALAAQSGAADAVWYAHSGLLNALICALPATLGLAFDGGHRGARRAWAVAAGLGAIGIVLHLTLTGVLRQPTGWEPLENPLKFSVLAVAWLTLVVMGRMAWDLGAQRPHEAPRWRALAATFALMPLMQLGTAILASPTSEILLASGGGLVMGTLRAMAAQQAPEIVEAPEAPEALREAA